MKINENKLINIAILDDHQIVIDGLKLLLETESSIKVVLEENNGFALMDKLSTRDYAIDVLLMDLVMPIISGDEVAMMMQEKFPEIKIIVLSMSNDGHMILKLIEQTEIKGYIPKSINKIALIEAIRKVFNGGSCFSDEILNEAEKYAKARKTEQDYGLTDREKTIIRYIAQGRTNKEIGSILFISEFTVATHRKNILKKTNTHNVGALIDLANKLKVV